MRSIDFRCLPKSIAIWPKPVNVPKKKCTVSAKNGYSGPLLRTPTLKWVADF